ncbi:MAG: hypothetical protein KDB61_00530 [Planctomycetes bacterium]|nr:hypothetical protein [Planctomycetota bacterium]
MSQTSTPVLLQGPFSSARFGKTLCIDITTPHNSLVVERGSELPRASLIVTTAARYLIDSSRNGDKLDHIMVIGTGVDPAEHPDLRNIVENLRALKDKWFARAKLALRTRTTNLDSYSLRSTLAKFNTVYIPMEWGTKKRFTAFTGCAGPDMDGLIKSMGALENLTLEAQFASGTTGNMSATDLAAWFKKIEEVSPAEVHLLGGMPRSETALKGKASTKPQRKKIQEDLLEKTGITAEIFEPETAIPE